MANKMSRTFLAGSLLMLLPSLAWAQGSNYRSTALSRRAVNGVQVALALPQAQIQVCTGTQTQIPCTPLATIYADSGLTTPLLNPFTADNNGNFSFWAPPGIYTVQITHPAAQPFSYTVVLFPTLASNNTWTGTNTFNSSLGIPVLSTLPATCTTGQFALYSPQSILEFCSAGTWVPDAITSFSLSMPPQFSVSGSPVVRPGGTLTIGWNSIEAGPSPPARSPQALSR